MEIPPISSTYTSSKPSAQPATVKRASELPTRGDIIHQQGDNEICCILECVFNCIYSLITRFFNFISGREEAPAAEPDDFDANPKPTSAKREPREDADIDFKTLSIDGDSPEALLQRLPPDRQLVVLTNEGPLDEVLFKDPNLLLREAEAYYANASFPEPLNFSDIPDGIPVEELLTRLLTRYDGLFIGEYHEDSAPKYFFVKYLPLMVKLGVDTIDIEGWNHEEWQEHFDAYFKENRITDELAGWFQRQREKFGQKYSEADVIIAAKKAGIKRVVCADTKASQSLPASTKHNDWKQETRRIAGGNYQSKCIIERTPGKGKRVGYWGGSHICSPAGVPGLGQIFQRPTISVGDLDGERPVVADLNKKEEFLVLSRPFYKLKSQRELIYNFSLLMAEPHKPKG
jgi:hypothetical protein